MTDPYAPKRNPAAEIVDLNRRQLPEFLRRQDGGSDDAHLAAVESELAGYIDSANTEHAVPTETVEQLDLVAGLKLILKKLTYSEMKGVAAGLVGGKSISTPGEMADALEAWSAGDGWQSTEKVA